MDPRVTELIMFLGDEAKRDTPDCFSLKCSRTTSCRYNFDVFQKCKSSARTIKILRKINNSEPYNPSDK